GSRRVSHLFLHGDLPIEGAGRGIGVGGRGSGLRTDHRGAVAEVELVGGDGRGVGVGGGRGVGRDRQGSRPRGRRHAQGGGRRRVRRVDRDRGGGRGGQAPGVLDRHGDREEACRGIGGGVRGPGLRAVHRGAAAEVELVAVHDALPIVGGGRGVGRDRQGSRPRGRRHAQGGGRRRVVDGHHRRGDR